MLKKTLFFSFCLALCAQSTVLLAGGVNMDDMCDAEKKGIGCVSACDDAARFFGA